MSHPAMGRTGFIDSRRTLIIANSFLLGFQHRLRIILDEETDDVQVFVGMTTKTDISPLEVSGLWICHQNQQPQIKPFLPDYRGR